MDYSSTYRLAQDIRDSEEYKTYHELKEEVMAEETCGNGSGRTDCDAFGGISEGDDLRDARRGRIAVVDGFEWRDQPEGVSCEGRRYDIEVIRESVVLLFPGVVQFIAEAVAPMLIQKPSGLKAHLTTFESAFLMTPQMFLVGHTCIEKDVKGIVFLLHHIQFLQNGGHTFITTTHTNIITLRPTAHDSQSEDKG